MKHRNKKKSNSRKHAPASQKRSVLFKSACAGLVGLGLGESTAHAYEVDETASPLVTGGDFSDTFPGDILPAGASRIVGSNFSNEDSDDFFQLTGLTSGSLFGISLSGSTSNYFVRFWDTAGNILPLTEVGSSGGNLSINDLGGGDFTAYGMGTVGATVPADGVIVAQAGPVVGGGAYTLTMVPEPSTAAVAALGGAALLGTAARRKLQSKKS